uniref:EB domain-containing protein n=1 Tax=Magallana gigas TaxID=29159 RepID=A0A8W8LU31_MAGGI
MFTNKADAPEVDELSIMDITLVIHKTTSSNIRRDLCLETVVRFVNHQNKCDFNENNAETFLQDDSTCPKKCNFRIENLHGRRYPLKRIDLTIGNETANISSCSGSSGHQKYLYVNCSSWNAREYIFWDGVYACNINDAQCVRIKNYCVCHCMPGSILEGKKCLKIRVNISGICEHNWQCNGTELANVCDNGLCVCNSGYIQNEKKCHKVKVNIGGICEHNWQCNGTEFANVCDDQLCVCNSGYIQNEKKCYKGYVTLNNPCELTEQCMQSFSGCINRSCKCKNGYSAFDTDSCLKLYTNNGVTLGTLFGGLILGVIVIAVITTLTYRRLKFPTRKMNLTLCLQTIEHTQKVATVSIYSFAKEMPGCNLPGKQQNERTEDVYNHLHEQTEHDDDTYDHACTAPNHGTDLSEYSHSRDIATVQSTSPFLDGGDYSTLGQ